MERSVSGPPPLPCPSLPFPVLAEPSLLPTPARSQSQSQSAAASSSDARPPVTEAEAASEPLQPSTSDAAPASPRMEDADGEAVPPPGSPRSELSAPQSAHLAAASDLTANAAQLYHEDAQTDSAQREQPMEVDQQHREQHRQQQEAQQWAVPPSAAPQPADEGPALEAATADAAQRTTELERCDESNEEEAIAPLLVVVSAASSTTAAAESFGAPSTPSAEVDVTESAATAEIVIVDLPAAIGGFAAAAAVAADGQPAPTSAPSGQSETAMDSISAEETSEVDGRPVQSDAETEEEDDDDGGDDRDDPIEDVVDIEPRTVADLVSAAADAQEQPMPLSPPGAPVVVERGEVEVEVRVEVAGTAAVTEVSSQPPALAIAGQEGEVVRAESFPPQPRSPVALSQSQCSLSATLPSAAWDGVVPEVEALSHTAPSCSPSSPEAALDRDAAGDERRDEEEAGDESSSVQYDSRQSSSASAQIPPPLPPAIRAESPSFGMTQLDAARDETSEREDDDSIAASERMDEDVQSQQLPHSQRSVASAAGSHVDVDAFTLEDDEDDFRKPHRVLQRSPRPAAEEGMSADAAHSGGDDDDVAMEDDLSVTDSATDGDERETIASGRPSSPPQSPGAPNAVRSPSPRRSPSFSQRDVDTLHERIAALQQRVAEQEATLCRSGEVDGLVHAMREEMDAERGAALEQRLRDISQLTMEKAELEDRAHSTALLSAQRERDLDVALQATQARLDAALARAQAKEDELTALRLESERAATLQRDALQQMETDLGALRRLLEQREGELTQLMSTPLAHRLDGLQQQLVASVAERDDAVKKGTESELRAKAARKDAKEQRRTAEKEREALEARANSLNLALQDLALKHSELTTKLAFTEQTTRRLEEQLKAAEADRKQLQASMADMTRLQVREEVHVRDVEQLKAERKELKDELRAQRDDNRALHERMREQHDAATQQKAAMQAQLDQVKAQHSADKERVVALTERIASAKEKVDAATRDHKQTKMELERTRAAGKKLEDEHNTALERVRTQEETIRQLDHDNHALASQREAMHQQHTQEVSDHPLLLTHSASDATCS